MGMATRAEKKLRKMRKAALGASKGLVVAGKLASASGATGVGRKLQAGGRAGRAAARGRGSQRVHEHQEADDDCR